MKNRVLALLVSWEWSFGLSHGFSFEDMDHLMVSPAFNLLLSTDQPDSGGFEFQREPEARLDSSAQTTGNSASSKQLVRDSDLWSGFMASEGLLDSRQRRTCPPGTAMCSDGLSCCTIGWNCVGNMRCCPAGNQRCGSSGCYNPGAGETCCGANSKFCERGFDCFPDRCCRKGTRPCGASACYDPKTETCCSATSTTCPITHSCVSGGRCCLKGTKLCGTSKCYDPATETCCEANSGLCGRQTGICALDTVCPRDKSCVAGNACCPKGHKLCGTNSCYDPDTQTCCPDTGEHCAKDYDCVPGGCCPSGMIRCGNTKCYNPKTSTCCQDKNGGNNWACNRGFQCCVASGGCFDANTQRCCPFGPCGINEACCGTMCCPDGYRCNRSKNCVKKRQPKPKTTTSCSTPTPAATRAPRPMQTIHFVYDPNRQVRNRNPANAAAGEFVPLSNHAVLMNMCRGMKNLNGGKDTQTARLTHGDECWKKRNRNIMCPTGFCKNAISDYVKQFFPNGIPSWAREAITAAGDLQCDEFPFASSLQGGDLVNGVTVCLPADDNGFQRYTMSKHFRDKKGGADIVAGEDYMISIDGWDCAKQAPITTTPRRHVGVEMFERSGVVPWTGLRKRDAFENTISRHGEEMYHGFDKDNSKLNLMTMPLGDLAAGPYIVNLDIASGNLSYVVVDNVGNTVDAELLPNGTVKFTLSDDWEAVTLAGTTEEEDVELTYEAEEVEEPAEATTTSGTFPTPTSTPGSIPTNRNGGNYEGVGAARGAFVVCVVAVVLVFK